MNDEFVTVWSGFLDDVQSCSETLVSDLESSLADMKALSGELEVRCRPSPDWELPALKPESVKSIYEDRAETLLIEVLDRYGRERLDTRLSSAFRDFDSRLEDAVRKLPVRASISPRELIDSLGDSTGMFWWAELVRVRDRERPEMVRASVLDGISEVRHGQRRLEGGFYLYHAQSVLGLLDPWQLVHGFSLEQLREEAEDDDRVRFDKAREVWKTRTERRILRGEDLLETFEKTLLKLPGQFTQALLRGPKPSRHRRQLARRRECESFWSRQRAGVRALIDIERAVVTLGSRSVELTEKIIREVQSEYHGILEELGAAISHLEGWQPGQPDPMPAASARLAAGSERVRLWHKALDRSCHELLPDDVEAVEPDRPLPGLRKPWRTLEPRRLFLDAVETAGETTEDGFATVENGHRKVLREIDRAREVVAYSLQARESESENGEQIAVEGVANALSLLRHQHESVGELTPSVEVSLVAATAGVFYRFLVGVERGRFSLASHIAREGAARAGRSAAVLIAEQAREKGRLAWTLVRRANYWSLVRIGWIAPMGETRKPVETWSYFGERMTSEGMAELPLIYDRLFRPEPVEDQRFLIGREEETRALEEARDFWNAGRPASVVLDGERGSGKTSLLNCAVVGPFAGQDVVRVSIRERLLTARALHEFLAGALEVDPDRVVGALNDSRRIVIIEEAERTFLRKVDGLAAIRELLSLVADTAASTLWVLSLTSEAFRFFNATLGLRSYFSHRLHASAVEIGELQDAILQRHNLSGLRLEFAQPPGKGRFQEWLRQQTERVQSPEESFFDGLHELSGGVFRSAFTIWRRHIDRVDGGILHMRFLDSPDHSRLTQALSSDDLFFLQMLLQHGSLTPEEDSRIFDCPLRLSYARIEHLMGRGILEPEPAAPGFRIQPEAGILVRGALNARNLL